LRQVDEDAVGIADLVLTARALREKLQARRTLGARASGNGRRCGLLSPTAASFSFTASMLSTLKPR
jgi:hypothetical protein